MDLGREGKLRQFQASEMEQNKKAPGTPGRAGGDQVHDFVLLKWSGGESEEIITVIKVDIEGNRTS